MVTGQPFEDALREVVLEPLGMRCPSFLPALPAELIGPGQAVGHTVRAGRAEVVRRWALPRLLAPACGLVCPASDLLRYARFHLGDGALAGGGRSLSPELMALMQEPRVGDARHNGCLASFADEVGLSWFSRVMDRGRSAGARRVEQPGPAPGPAPDPRPGAALRRLRADQRGYRRPVCTPR